MKIEHMDSGSRNARLYETLKGMGLYVIPVFLDGDQNQIDHFHVAVGLPAYLAADAAKQTTRTAIPAPVPSAEIVRLVRPAED